MNDHTSRKKETKKDRPQLARIPIILVFFGGLWILLSDWMLSLMVNNLENFSRLQTLKGGFFVLCMGLLAYLLIRYYNAVNQRLDREQQLARERYMTVIEGTRDFVTQLDRRGNFVFVNPRAPELLGLPADQCPGRYAFDFVHPEDRLKTETWFQGCLRARVTHAEIDNRQVSLDGRVTHMAWSCNFHYDNEGRLEYVNSIAHDINAQKLAEIVLEENLRLKSEFISIAAHELNTPLAAIMTSAEMLRMKEELGLSPQQSSELLDIIFHRSEAMATIVEDFLNLQKIDEGGVVELNLTPCDLWQLTARASQQFQVTHPDRTIKLIGEPTSLPQALADQAKLAQVIDNLLGNACKYSPDGSTIELSCVTEGDLFLLGVRDSGIGMDSEIQSRVFEKFFRADASDSAVAGFGLGLNIAANIVKMHGGTIEIESAPNQGTLMTVKLPLRRIG